LLPIIITDDARARDGARDQRFMTIRCQSARFATRAQRNARDDYESMSSFLVRGGVLDFDDSAEIITRGA